MQLFTPIQYLMIDIANSFGLDKENWTFRLNWFKENEKNLYNMIIDAKEPAKYFAGLEAYDRVSRGLPIGYPISLDATSSGWQILSVLICDKVAAALSNVIPNAEDKRMNAYTEIYELMLKALGGNTQIEPEDVKRAIMTSLYGSEAVPKEVFGDGVLFNTFEKTMNEVVPYIWNLNKKFLDIWDSEASIYSWVLPDNFHVHCKVMSSTTDTVHFENRPYSIVRKINAPTEEGRSLGANTVHSIDGLIVRELTRRCDYDPKQINHVKGIAASKIMSSPYRMNYTYVYDDSENKKMTKRLWDHYNRTGYLSARILDYITPMTIDSVDASTILNLIESMPSHPFKVLSIHDCFRVHPNYGNDLRKQYNIQLHLLAKSNLLSDLLTQITKSDFKIGKADESFINDILEADYSLS